MTYTTLFFDLDDTVYPSTTGLWAAIRERMNQYMVERLGVPAARAQDLRKFYFETYGTTLRGLQRDYQVDVDEYLAYVHDLKLADYLQVDPQLAPLLRALPQTRWIFTNADIDHARRVLDFLGLQDCFAGIIDVRAIDFACKPEPIAYQRALALVGGPQPAECILIDDAPRNLAGARALGFTTVLVGPHPSENGVACYTIPSLLDLPQALPELWITDN